MLRPTRVRVSGTLSNGDLLTDPSEVPMAGVRREHLDGVGAGLMRGQLAAVHARLTCEGQQHFLDDLVAAKQLREHLDVVSVPEPAGLRGTPSYHDDIRREGNVVS